MENGQSTLVAARFGDGIEGAPGASVPFLGGVIEFFEGWFTDAVLVRTQDGVGEITIDGSWRWGPVEPPFVASLVGPWPQQRALWATPDGLVAWGPGDEGESFDVVADTGSRYLASGPTGWAWLDPTGRLWVQDNQDVREVPLAELPFERWTITTAAMSSGGVLAIVNQDEPEQPAELVLVQRSGGVVLADSFSAAAADDEMPPVFIEIHWSPDNRWLFAAAPDHEVIAAHNPGRERSVYLPISLPGHSGMAVARVAFGSN
jgi:hypothetical protein